MMKARRTKRGTKYRVTETQGGVLFGNVTNARLVRVSKISWHSFASISNRYLSGPPRILSDRRPCTQHLSALPSRSEG